MKRALLIALLCTLLGVAGYWYFEHWYGWLTSMGGLALRYGSVFAWRVLLRTLRRQLVMFVFPYLPSFIKRPIRQAGRHLKQHLDDVLGSLRGAWKNSWAIRLCILLPLMGISLTLAYDAEGFLEFVYLVPLPFLTTAIFPEGFWTVAFVYILNLLATHGFEQVIERLSTLAPDDFVRRYRDGRNGIQRLFAETSRPARAHANRLFQTFRKNGTDTSPAETEAREP